jgi:hypothetical protein
VPRGCDVENDVVAPLRDVYVVALAVGAVIARETWSCAVIVASVVFCPVKGGASNKYACGREKVVKLAL